MQLKKMIIMMKMKNGGTNLITLKASRKKLIFTKIFFNISLRHRNGCGEAI